VWGNSIYFILFYYIFRRFTSSPFCVGYILALDAQNGSTRHHVNLDGTGYKPVALLLDPPTDTLYTGEFSFSCFDFRVFVFACFRFRVFSFSRVFVFVFSFPFPFPFSFSFSLITPFLTLSFSISHLW
jgi:hypothetical protein